MAIARGEQEFFDPNGVATATEACKSNALMRCCKDLGIASELWYVFMFFVVFGFIRLLSIPQGSAFHSRIQGQTLC